MRKRLINNRDLDEAIRKKTGEENTPVACVVLGRDGALTVRPQEGGDS